MLASLPLMMGAEGDCGNVNSRDPAPDVEGEWDIAYDDVLGVEIKIGGAVYEETLGAAGGVVSINHDGNPFEFDLDCEREDVLCPSEAWPGTVFADQRNPNFPSRMWVTLPKQTCNGNTVQPSADECGEGTDNPDCEMVCDGETIVEDRDVFGVIGEGGDTFRLSLGGGIATNGINCVLLGLSFADADLVNIGAAEDGDWEAVEMENGIVTAGYSGSCLWIGDVNNDAQLEALALGAEVTFTTGFTGLKQ
jgi:hypothetical protein